MNKDKYSFIQAKINDKVGVIEIYGEIADEKWYKEDVTPIEISEKLKGFEDCSDIHLRINSYGGSVFAGQAIINMLDSYKAKKTAYIDGIAASMASVIAVSCDEIIMPDNALMMVHKPIASAAGNATHMREAAEMLDKAEQTLIAVYMRHFKGTEDELRNLLEKETWLTANEALQYGFITSKAEAVKLTASAKGIVLNSLEIDKNNIIYSKLKEKGMLDKAMDIKERIKSLGIEVTDEDTSDTLLDKAIKSLENAVPAFEAEISIVENEDGSKSAMVGEKELCRIEAKTVEKTIEVVNAEIQNKADMYDKLKKQAIGSALKNGVKAKANNFNNERWTKILNGFTIDEINAQSDEWLKEAETVLNAGKHLTESNDIGNETLDVTKFKL